MLGKISFSQRCKVLFLFWILQLFLSLLVLLSRTVIQSSVCKQHKLQVMYSVSVVFSTYDPCQDVSVWNRDHRWLSHHANAAAVPYVISVKYTISTISGLMLLSWWLNNIIDEQGFSFVLINMPSSFLLAYFFVNLATSLTSCLYLPPFIYFPLLLCSVSFNFPQTPPCCYCPPPPILSLHLFTAPKCLCILLCVFLLWNFSFLVTSLTATSFCCPLIFSRF